MHGTIWTINDLEKGIMKLNNLTDFHKILIKTIRLSLDRRTYISMLVRTDRRTGVTLHAPDIVMVGALKVSV